jgi:glycogen phosphorylase
MGTHQGNRSVNSPAEARAVLGLLAGNMRSTWDQQTIELFERIDSRVWHDVRHNPVEFLNEVGDDALRVLVTDASMRSDLEKAHSSLRTYMDNGGVYSGRPGGVRTIAYFSPEFGVAEFLPTYSGGLGILAGDHVKAASDLGIPLVGVGLLYREGYFRQSLDTSGWQEESYPRVDPAKMPLRPLLDGGGRPVTIEIDLAGKPCSTRVWVADVGRLQLLLLDADVDSNAPAERAVTDRLYGGDREHRLRQEIVLGIGGVRAIRAAGIDPDVWHSNEGHAGFLGLERVRELVSSGSGFDFYSAIENVRPSTVFTTHTPLAVAIDVFDQDLMEGYFTDFARECGVSFEELMSIGRPSASERKDPGAPTFNMAVMGIRLAAGVNGVSRLHGEVSRDLFNSVWPDLGVEQVPITHVTNGVHVATWLGPEIRALIGSSEPATWPEDPEADWKWVDDVSDKDLWDARTTARARLIGIVRARLWRQLRRRGHDPNKLVWTKSVLDPKALTIGFARRFAPYKRATLMLADADRLRKLLLDADRPVQVLLAGKAHPIDDAGKEMIRSLLSFSSHDRLRGRLIFLEDYDMELGRALTQGVDVWLNNPRRPLEACGTSGMKAALNGVINCSVLDGWWDECFDETVGWAIGDRVVSEDLVEQDARDAEAAYAVLENAVVPAFYQRTSDGLPVDWIALMRASIARLGERLSAHRMLNDYVQQLYEPAAVNSREGD